MTPFVMLAALLAVVAIAIVVWPLWKTARPLALALMLLLPIAGGALYALKGQPLALDPVNVRQPTTIEEAIAQMETRLAATPDDVEGRVLLARTYGELGKAAEAEAMLRQAIVLRPDDMALAVEYAEAQVRAAPDHTFTAKSVALLERAVAAQPDSQRGLFLLGVHRLRSGQPAEAAALWERLLPLVGPAAGGTLRQEINLARAEAKLPPLPEATISGPSLQITLDVSPALRAEAKPGDVVFIFARAPGGAGPPAAAKRIVLAELPMTLTLSDADSPMPAAKLSTQTSVVVSARLSRSGAVASGTGDLEAEPVTLRVTDKGGATLTLSRRLP